MSSQHFKNWVWQSSEPDSWEFVIIDFVYTSFKLLRMNNGLHIILQFRYLCLCVSSSQKPRLQRVGGITLLFRDAVSWRTSHVAFCAKASLDAVFRTVHEFVLGFLARLLTSPIAFQVHFVWSTFFWKMKSNACNDTG